MEKSSFCFVQCEYARNACYETHAFSPLLHKYGYVAINIESGYVAHVSFNSVADYEEMLLCDVGKYTCLDGLRVGDSTTIDGETFVRLW